LNSQNVKSIVSLIILLIVIGCVKEIDDNEMSNLNSNGSKESSEFSEFNIVVVNGRLKFPNQETFRSAMDFIEENDEGYIDPPDLENVDSLFVNRLFDAFESEHEGYISLRRRMIDETIAIGESGQEITEENDPFNHFLSEDDLSIFINENLELMIGDTIIKFLDENISFKLFGDNKETYVVQINDGVYPSHTLDGVNTFVQYGPIGGTGSVSSTAGDDCPLTFSYTISGNTVSFHSLIGGVYQDILWDFGDGTTNTTQRHPNHTYSQAGSYNVNLDVSGQDWSGTGACGSPGQSNKTAYTGSCSPQFSATYTSGFDIWIDDNTHNPSGENYQCLWDFDNDGITDYISGPGQGFYWSFQSGGTKYIKMTLSSSGTCSGKFTAQNVTVPIGGSSSTNNCHGATSSSGTESIGSKRRMRYYLKSQNFGALSINRVVAKTLHQQKILGLWVPKKADCQVQMSGQVWIDCQGFLQLNEHCGPAYNVTTTLLSNYAANNHMKWVWDSYDLGTSNSDCSTFNGGATSAHGKPVRIKNNSVGSLHLIPNDTPEKTLSIK
jgi:PKD repeat protein